MVKKKKIYIILIIVFLLIIAFVLYLLINQAIMKKRAKDSLRYVLPHVSNSVQMMYAYDSIVYCAENSGIHITDEVKNELQECRNYMYKCFEKYGYGEVPSDLLAEIVFSYELNGLKGDKLKKEIQKRIDDSTGLLREYGVASYLTEEIAVSNNQWILEVIRKIDNSYFDIRPIENKLTEWFNATINENTTDFTEYNTIAFYFWKKYGDIDRLNSTIVLDEIKKYTEEEYSKISEYKSILSDVVLMDTCSIYNEMLSAEYPFKEYSQRLYDGIDSYEELGYDQSAMSLFYVNVGLKAHYDAMGTIYSEYIEENINEILLEHILKWKDEYFG